MDEIDLNKWLIWVVGENKIEAKNKETEETFTGSFEEFDEFIKGKQ